MINEYDDLLIKKKKKIKRVIKNILIQTIYYRE